MERLSNNRGPKGIGRTGLRTWGLLLLAADIVSRSVLQNWVLGLGKVSTGALLDAMQSSDTVMMYATAALVLQIMGTCAIPVFAFLLAEGARHTSDLRSYALRVTGVALLSELPYNFAMSGNLFGYGSQNPAFGLVLALVAIAFCQQYAKKDFKCILVRIIVTVAAVVWCGMLRIDNGIPLVLTALVLWRMWDKAMLRNIAGASVMLLCSMFSLFLMASPMAFLIIHMYNGEKKEEENRLVNYLAYPALLLFAGLAGKFLM